MGFVHPQYGFQLAIFVPVRCAAASLVALFRLQAASAGQLLKSAKLRCDIAFAPGTSRRRVGVVRVGLRFAGKVKSTWLFRAKKNTCFFHLFSSSSLKCGNSIRNQLIQVDV